MCASCVELVTFDQLRQRYPQLEQHRIAPSGGAFCRAERLKGGGAAGTYAMPRPMAPTGEKHFFGFYLTQRRLLLAEDGEFLRGLADDLEAGTPAQALAELFTRLLQEDMPTLQKYEKRLTTLEEALMQDQAQDLDKKLFRIRRELSVFAAYYEQLDDLFAVLSEIPFDLMYGGTWFYPFHQNVIWTLLIGLSGIHLMEKVRKKRKLWIFLPTAILIVLVGSALGTVGMADYYGAGVLLFPGKKMVVFFRTASGALLGQCRAAGRSDVPHPAFWDGL